MIVLAVGHSHIAGQFKTLDNSAGKKNLAVIAHRGNHSDVPENTLEAFQKAIDCGADYVEVDVRTTSDGRFVVMHNATVDKMTNGTGVIKDLRFGDIKKLEIKNYRNDGITYSVPSFEEVLQVCKGRIKIYLDFKDGDVEKAFQLIKKYGMEKDVAVYINSEILYHQWRRVAPQLPLIASIPEEIYINQVDSFLNEKKINIIDNAYSKEMVDFLHQRNMLVWLDVEGVDEGPDIWRKALNLKVDGLQTDHPRRLIKYLKEEGLR
jgi:glycerophosphoryl diester phosphodiesterase